MHIELDGILFGLQDNPALWNLSYTAVFNAFFFLFFFFFCQIAKPLSLQKLYWSSLTQSNVMKWQGINHMSQAMSATNGIYHLLAFSKLLQSLIGPKSPKKTALERENLLTFHLEKYQRTSLNPFSSTTMFWTFGKVLGNPYIFLANQMHPLVLFFLFIFLNSTCKSNIGLSLVAGKFPTHSKLEEWLLKFHLVNS